MSSIQVGSPRSPARNAQAGERWAEPVARADPYGLLALSTTMLDSGDDRDIVGLLMRSVAALGPCRVVAVHLCRDHLTLWPPGAAPGRREGLDRLLATLGGRDGPVATGAAPWSWAFALHDLDHHVGHLVVEADAEPDDEARAVLRTLARHAGAALAAAVLRRREDEHALTVRQLAEERALVTRRLTATVSDLRRHREMDEAFARASELGEGEAGIARVLHALTGLAVTVEDCCGTVQARAGTDGPPVTAAAQDPGRDDLLHRALRQPGVLRDGGRLIALARSRGEILGVLVVADPAHGAGPTELFAVEHAAALLAMQLAYRRTLGEVERRLRRDLANDLLTGIDAAGAYARLAQVGHDLRRPQHVAAIAWRGVPDDAIEDAAERATAALGLTAMATRASGAIALITDGRPEAAALYRAMARELGCATGTVGVGGRCERAGDFPRSYREAVRALRVRGSSHHPDGATDIEELGIVRILGASDDCGEIEGFVRQWLGPLLDYDARHHGNLVGTVAEYLDRGGNYDATAAALVIHRSTLRYRLQRIREIAGLDLHDVDQRLSVHVATRAWRIVDGPDRTG